MLIDPTILHQDELILEAGRILSEAGENVASRARAIDEITHKLFETGDPGTIDLFVDELCLKFKIKKKVFTEKIKVLERERKTSGNGHAAEIDLPDGVGIEAYETGWFKHKHCYMFITKDGIFKASNFTVQPLYHIYSKRDNKRLIKITNEHGLTKILDIPSKIMTSPDQFQGIIFGEGHFLFFGSKFHFFRVLDDFSKNFPVANELRTLGWQREGFYAFANGIYATEWRPVDDLGVSEHNGHKYFSPSFSSIYTDVREDDDEYENDRFFIYKPIPENMNFSKWSKLMLKVYGTKSRIAIAFAIACMFRDVIYERYKIFPLMFLFGDKGTGKSQLAWSVSNIFFDNMPGFNLNSGTQVGFFRRLSRVKNAICWFDEYTNDIDERRFQSIKASYDGLGHEKGEKTQDNRTTITKINSGIMVSGQYLPNRDSNALFSRSILLSFEPKTYTKEETDNYDKLKQLEEHGLSGILPEILTHRETITKQYARTFSDIFEDIKTEMVHHNENIDERLVRNFTCILASMKILETKLDFGFTYKQLEIDCRNQILEMNRQISSSESVSTFWSMIEFLLDEGKITEGVDFKIETLRDLKNVIRKSGATEDLNYADYKDLAFFRFGKIHPLYMEAHRRQYGKNGVELVSILHYLKHHKAFLGRITSTRFSNSITSAYVFDYEKLGVNLKRFNVTHTDQTDQQNYNPTNKHEIKPTANQQDITQGDFFNNKPSDEPPY